MATTSVALLPDHTHVQRAYVCMYVRTQYVHTHPTLPRATPRSALPAPISPPPDRPTALGVCQSGNHGRPRQPASQPASTGAARFWAAHLGACAACLGLERGCETQREAVLRSRPGVAVYTTRYVGEEVYIQRMRSPHAVRDGREVLTAGRGTARGKYACRVLGDSRGSGSAWCVMCVAGFGRPCVSAQNTPARRAPAAGGRGAEWRLYEVHVGTRVRHRQG